MTDLIWPAWLWLLVNALATYRITRLITDDLIADPLRARVTRLGEPWASAIECPWCMSFWVLLGGMCSVAVSYAFPQVKSRPFGAHTDPIGL
jgi:hypothetical protein